MAASKEQAVKNLKRKSTTGRIPRQHLTKQELAFLAHYVFSGKPKEAAIYAGIPVGQYIYMIIRKPAAQAFLKQQRDEMASGVLEDVKKEFELTNELIDIEVAKRLVKPKIKDAIFVDLAEVAYKSTGRIQPARTVVSQTAAGMIGGPASPQFLDVYEAKWLRERKSGWSKQLEQKHGTPAGNSST